MPRIGIVGAGPAGSALALALVDRGVDPADLVLYDRARFPRQKLCGGALTHRGTERLAALIGEIDGGARTLAIRFRSAFGEVEVFERGVQWLYDRALLDHALLQEVKKRDVEVREEDAVTALEAGAAGWRVRTANGVESYDWIAGADGALGPTRRASGLRGAHVGRLVEGIFEARSADVDPSRLYFDFDPVLDGIPGYAWIFPYPDPSGRLYKIGVMDGRGRVSGEALRAWTARFAEERGFRLADEKIAGWPERYFSAGARGHRPGLVLVGEAFGIDPLLGEGIAPALHHAIYAADRLKGALDRKSDRIRGYESGFLRTPEGKNLRFQSYLADLVYGRSGIRWMRALFDLPRLRELAAAGDDDYGRLAHRAPSLIASCSWYLLTHGLPSAKRPS